MSLGKLLATGRSLIGGAPEEGRYNISNANRLPKFGAVKNPFAPSATSEARPANELPVAAVVPPVAPSPVVLPPNVATVEARVAEFVRQSESACAPAPTVPQDETQRIPELADQPFARSGEAKKVLSKSAVVVARLQHALRAAAGLVLRSARCVWQFVRGLKWDSAGAAGRAAMAGFWPRLKAVSLKLAGLIRRPEPKPVFPRLGKPAVQTELSLDAVRVVRNSLEDSDLEIVAAPTATGAQVAPSAPVASPKRGPVPPALKKLTDRLLNVKALEKALD